MNTEPPAEEFSLWVTPEDRRYAFRGRVVGRGWSLAPSNITHEATIYMTVQADYVVTLAELLPWEIEQDDRSPEAHLKQMCGRSLPRSTVTYAARFASLEAVAQSDHDGFIINRWQNEALSEALDSATEGGNNEPESR